MRKSVLCPQINCPQINVLTIMEARGTPPAETAGEPAAKTEETVSFNPSPVKTGFEADGEHGFSEEIWTHVVATVNPSSITLRDAVEFSLDGDENEIDLSYMEKIDPDKWVFDVGGLQMTPADKSEGDLKILGVKGEKTLGEVQVVVYVPWTNEHIAQNDLVPTNPRPSLVRDWGGNIVALQCTTSATLTIRIEVKDQFGNMLDSLYNGTGVVTETLHYSEQHGVGAWPSEGLHTITLPDADFTDGVKLDGCTFADGACCYYPVGPGTSQEYIELFRDMWQQFIACVEDESGNQWNNAIAGVEESGCTLTQEIRVRGHHVTPDYTRTVLTHKVDVPGAIFTVEDN